jgi:hypothetical protein
MIQLTAASRQIRRYTLYRQYLTPVSLTRKSDATIDQFAVEQHSTRATLTRLAAVLYAIVTHATQGV